MTSATLTHAELTAKITEDAWTMVRSLRDTLPYALTDFRLRDMHESLVAVATDCLWSELCDLEQAENEANAAQAEREYDEQRSDYLAAVL